MNHIKRNIAAGIIACLPLAVSLWFGSIVFDFLSAAGMPVANWIVAQLSHVLPGLEVVLATRWVLAGMAAIVTVVGFYVLGILATAVLGRRLFGLVDAIMERVPLIEAVYRAARKLLASFEKGAGSGQRVVLIEFPSPEMKTIGLVTRVFRDVKSGEEIAAVYVPTTPNPTSGYMELVPTDKLVWLDWTTAEAMQFIVSGGTSAPERLRFRRDDEGASAVPVD